MVSRRKTSHEVSGGPRSPARTPEERENQLIDAAVDLAEQQLKNGEASAQVITHFLKLGSSREKLEQIRIKHENALLVTKREVMESEKRTEELVANALEAMRAYTGNSGDKQDPEYDEYQE